jgi:hypothetical protein
VNGTAISCSLACSGVRQALRLLQRRQAVTTLFQVSCPPRDSGVTWSLYSLLFGKRCAQ